MAVEPLPLLVPGRSYAPDSLRKTRAQSARTFYQHAIQLEHDGLPQPAMAAYRNAAALDPTIPGVYAHIGRLYEAFGVETEALKAYAEEVRRHPKNRDAARELGLTLSRLGENDRAIQQLDLLVRTNSRDGASWRALGYAYTNAKKFRDAERALRMAIALPPAEAEEYRDLGVLLANRGREAEARTLYARAAQLDPHDGSVFVDLGNLEMRDGRPEAALAKFREAEVRDTSNALAYRAEVLALESLGRDAEVGDAYRRWLHHAPDDEAARLEAVQYFLKTGRRDVALETAREGLRRAPHSGYAHMILGVAEGGSGHTRDAIVEFRRAQGYADVAGDNETTRQALDLLAELKTGAPDSLRALFVADSLEMAAAQARVDSLRRAGPPMPIPKPVPTGK